MNKANEKRIVVREVREDDGVSVAVMVVTLPAGVTVEAAIAAFEADLEKLSRDLGWIHDDVVVVAPKRDPE